MGRRALRIHVDDAALESHWIVGDELARPLLGSVIFGRTAPLEIEIGTGKGLFLRTAAASHPERDFLGIEIAKKYTVVTAGYLARAKLNNARIVHGDAQPILRTIPDASIAAVHVYFPDPWWKRRHRKRRVMNRSFVRDVQRLLVAGGQFHFWTDVKEYFDVSIELVQAATRLDGPFAVPERPAEHDLDYHTHFERRMRRHDAAVYRARFEKRPATAADPAEEENAHAK